jgi:hypothetical protein
MIDSHDRDRVLECADTGDGDSHGVVRFERERIGWDDASAGQQDGAVRERLGTEQVVDELGAACRGDAFMP